MKCCEWLVPSEQIMGIVQFMSLGVSWLKLRAPSVGVCCATQSLSDTADET